MLRTFLNVAVCVCLYFLSATPPLAKSFALLIGVSDYDETIGLADLRGPANDVRLLRDVLTERGEFDIRVLADGVKGGIRPTRHAILSHLDDLADTAVAGDFVYIHMSGHGTQQPDRDGDETDGLDEVFLPADTARAEPGTSVIPNAIIDEELGSRIAALRAKGVDVWFVLDSCHSGSGLRAGSPRVRTRFVDPAVLGVNVNAVPQPASTSVLDGPGADDLPGRYLAFYSAQSSELAREILVDETAENGWYGLFTSRLAARMQTDAALSYRQLFQAVLSDLGDASVPGGARLQTPLWEGNLVDAPVFGGGDLVAVRQFALKDNRLQAGLLHGLSDNTVVALVQDASAGADDLLAFAQLQDTDARSAALVMVNGACVASVDASCERLGDLPAQARFARLVAKPQDAVMRIAPPVMLDTGTVAGADIPLHSALIHAVSQVNAELGSNIQIDPNASVLSGIAQGKLWFGTKLTAGATPIGLSWMPSDGPLSDVLTRISKAENMAATFANVAGTPSLLFPSPVKIEVQRVVSDVEKLATSIPADLRDECRAALHSASVVGDLPPGQNVKQCDQMAFGAQGVVQGPARDVNRIYIDSQYCVSAEYQRVEGTAQPAILGGTLTICSDCPTPTGVETKAGMERMFVVVSEAEDNREALNLEGLLDNCSTDTRATRSAGQLRQVGEFLNTLVRSDPTRGGMGGFGISHIWVETFHWVVLPRHAARASAGLTLDE
ncbi:MAG: caspase family protein [Sulfitobacter sp.]